jgi:hypothetical protein
MMSQNLSTVIASEAKQSIQQHVALWIASSLTLLAMTIEMRRHNNQKFTGG